MDESTTWVLVTVAAVNNVVIGIMFFKLTRKYYRLKDAVEEFSLTRQINEYLVERYRQKSKK